MIFIKNFAFTHRINRLAGIFAHCAKHAMREGAHHISAHVYRGFHDAVRTPFALLPGRHVGFFWNNNLCFNFVSILFEKIKLTVSERTYIIVPMV